MNKEALEQLAKLRGAPAVSILCPLDTRRPGNPHDTATLATLRDRAAEQVRATVEKGAATSTMSRVDDALASLDLQHPPPGVAVFVSTDVSQVVPLDTSVDPEVVVGERFAIRGLLTAVLQSPRVRVVALSQTGARCIDLTGSNATERLDHGFPLEVHAPVEADAPHRDFPLDEHEHAEAAKFALRAVAKALRALQRHDDRPLVLLGAERDLAYFDEITDEGASVIGRVHGDYEREAATAIAEIVRPALDAYQHERQQLAGDEVREAIGSRAVAGVTQTWTAARAGRGHRLVVEQSLRFPAHVVGEALEAARPDESDVFDAVEDTIEEVIRHGGDVIVVPQDCLSDVGRIALLTRY